MNLILPKIITGGSLESLFYAYIHETPIVLTQPYVPFELDVVEDNSFFELLGYTAEMPLTKWTAANRSERSFRFSMLITGTKTEAGDSVIETIEEAALPIETDSEIGVELAQEDPASIAVN